MRSALVCRASTIGSSGRPASFTRVRPRVTRSWRSAFRSGSWRSTLRCPVTSLPRGSMEHFATVPEQPEAKRLLGAALAEGPAHAYLLHGPRGVGKTTAARAFASALLGGDPRAARERPTHPDLYLLEPLGEMIRIDDIRELRHDLHMRPFEADRRVYVLLDAHLLNKAAPNPLSKVLRSPPGNAAIWLAAADPASLPGTI